MVNVLSTEQELRVSAYKQEIYTLRAENDKLRLEVLELLRTLDESLEDAHQWKQETLRLNAKQIGACLREWSARMEQQP